LGHSLNATVSEPGDPAIAAAPFVGREPEIARLTFLMERAAAGSGAVALVTGEAGIGKTTLAGEFLRRARERDPGMVLCRGRCVEQYGPSEAYLPFLDALGTLLLGRGREPTAALLRAYAPTWCLQLPAIAASPVSRDRLESQTIGATKQRMLREMGDLFEAAAADSLMVALLEDVQWADLATTDVVRHLVNRIARQRILLIGTFRPGELQATGHPLQAFVADLRNHALTRSASALSMPDT
jgi:predicted ATPase